MGPKPHRNLRSLLRRLIELGEELVDRDGRNVAVGSFDDFGNVNLQCVRVLRQPVQSPLTGCLPGNDAAV